MLSFLFGRSEDRERSYTGQRLDEVPMEQLQELEDTLARLCLKNNIITEIPAQLRLFENLTHLDLDNNRIRRIPSFFYHMTTLRHVSLQNNDLTKLEPELAHLNRLRTLKLKGNPLAWPPIDIVEKLSTGYLRDWINDHPSYKTWRFYLPVCEDDDDDDDEMVPYLDMNIATAHAKVKETKKNEDRWESHVFVPGQDTPIAQKTFWCDKKHKAYQMGDHEPNPEGHHCFEANAAYVGVYDGHGGHLASAALEQNLLKSLAEAGLFQEGPFPDDFNVKQTMIDVYEDLDERLCTKMREMKKKAGSTCTTVLVRGTSLIVAHVGDSRAIMGPVDGKVLDLTLDHHPKVPEEEAKILERGGKVTRKEGRGCWRVNGDLNMSRSFGDIKLKFPVRILDATPDVLVRDLSEETTDIVVASDGLWAYMTSANALEMARRHDTAEDAARALTERIMDLIEGTTHRGDNTSVTCIKLRHGKCRRAAIVQGRE